MDNCPQNPIRLGKWRHTCLRHQLPGIPTGFKGNLPTPKLSSFVGPIGYLASNSLYYIILQNLEEDEEFQQALKTSHGQRPGVVSDISLFM